MKIFITLLLLVFQEINSFAQTCSPLDQAFGNGGVAIGMTFPVGNFSSPYSTKIILQPDNKIIQAGTIYSTSTSDFFVLRYKANGTLDSAFGTNGKTITQVGNSYSNATDAALQIDGKIVVIGNTNTNTNGSDFAIVRYNNDGSLDNSFGTGGKLISTIGTGNDYANGLAIQPDGKIVIAGSSDDNKGFEAFAVARYQSNGNPDNSFGQNGKIISHYGHYIDSIKGKYFGQYYYESAREVVIQTDGKIVVAGQSYSHECDLDYYGGAYCQPVFAMVRYNSNGSVDSTFGKNGKVADSLNLYYPSTTALQPDGKIVITGSGVFAGRYNSDGSLDNSFGIGGKTIVNPPNGFQTQDVSSIIQPDGKIVFACSLYGLNISTSGVQLARLNANGSPDSSFYTNGKLVFHVGSAGTYDEVRGLALQNDKLILGTDIRNDGISVVRLSNSTSILPVIISKSGPDAQCKGDSVRLSVDQTGSIQWNKNGIPITGAIDTVYYAKSTGSYTSKIINSSGCGESLPINIFINDVELLKPVITANGSLNLCPGANVILSTTAQGYLQWYKNGIGIPGENANSFKASDKGSYSVSVYNNYGCIAFSLPAIVSLVNNPVAPVINALGPVSFCSGQSVALTSHSPDKLQWYKNSIPINGATDSVYTATASGIYSVLATNTFGCGVASSSTLTVSANEPPKPPINWTSTYYFSTTSGYVHYDWFLNGVAIAGIDSNNYKPSQTGIYKVIVTDNNGCKNTSDNYNLVALAVADITIGDAKLRYYPNPSQTFLNIDVSNPYYNKLVAEIYDLNGRLMQKQLLNQAHNQLPVHRLSSGLYQLVIYNNHERVTVKVMVIK